MTSQERTQIIDDLASILPVLKEGEEIFIKNMYFSHYNNVCCGIKKKNGTYNLLAKNGITYPINTLVTAKKRNLAIMLSNCKLPTRPEQRPKPLKGLKIIGKINLDRNRLKKKIY